MSVITLTTDWLSDDFYIGALKGRILTDCPNAIIVDISHKIQSFNTAQAAFVINGCYRNFPEDSIHIIGVRSDINKHRSHIIVRLNGHYFIGADNGIFGLINDMQQKTEIIKIEQSKIQGNNSPAFPELSVFAYTAAYIANGNNFRELGNKIEKYSRQIPLCPAIEDAVIHGRIIYIDSYKNAITNISRELFERIGKNRKFRIYIKSNHYLVTKINQTYSDTSEGELLALFNSLDLLEIAQANGNISELLNLDFDTVVRINFFD